MSKRKCKDDEHIEEHKTNKKQKVGPHQFEPTLIITYRVAVDVSNYKKLVVTFPDCVWRGINKTKRKSSYYIERWFISRDVLWVDAENISNGEKCRFPAIWLVARHNEWKIIDIKPMPKTTLDELGYIGDHSDAQERSVRFAELVVERRKPGEYVLILDGLGRNRNELVKAGVPEKYIITCEREYLTSLYHKLLSIRLDQPFIDINTGEYQRHAKDGIENLIYHERLPYQDKISCAYFDFDCDIPETLLTSLESKKMPNLKLCGITQAKRNRHTEFRAMGKSIERYNNSRVVCEFTETNFSGDLESDEDLLQYGFKKDPKKQNTYLLIE